MLSASITTVTVFMDCSGERTGSASRMKIVVRVAVFLFKIVTEGAPTEPMPCGENEIYMNATNKNTNLPDGYCDGVKYPFRQYVDVS